MLYVQLRAPEAGFPKTFNDSLDKISGEPEVLRRTLQALAGHFQDKNDRRTEVPSPHIFTGQLVIFSLLDILSGDLGALRRTFSKFREACVRAHNGIRECGD